MAVPSPGEVTRLLRAHEAGDGRAFELLVPLVYDEMRRIARAQLRKGGGWPKFETGSLVNEAYLKLTGGTGVLATDRKHLLAIAAAAMRQVLVDRARARQRDKRGGGAQEVPLEEADARVAAHGTFVLELDRALALLRERDERMAQVFDCRFFAGLGDAETAEALELPLRTVQRDFMRARAWLRAELGELHGD